VAAAEHASGYVPFAILFALLVPLQSLWGVWVCFAPSRRLLVAGGIGSLLIVAVWVVSRTAGLPLGPEPWQPEAIGPLDVVASADELVIALLVALRLPRLAH
jgi:hypothetical protein